MLWQSIFFFIIHSNNLEVLNKIIKM
jgi:hypothetical protein